MHRKEGTDAARCSRQQDPEKRGAETHERLEPWGDGRGMGGGSLVLISGTGAAGREHCPPPEKTPWARVLPTLPPPPTPPCTQCAPGLALFP